MWNACVIVVRKRERDASRPLLTQNKIVVTEGASHDACLYNETYHISYLHLFRHVVAGNLGKPPAVPFPAIDVETDGHSVLQVEVKLLDFVITKHLEGYLLRILLDGFQNKSLGTPLVACTLRHTALGWKYRYDSTCCFHLSVFYGD